MTPDKLTKKWIRNSADERAASRGCRFDEARGQHVIDFAAKYLKLYEGECAGEPLIARDWQIEATMRLFSWVKHSDRFGREVRRFNQASIWVPKKNKKAMALDTPIPTPWGWATMGELRPGDKVFGENGQPCNVIAAHPQVVDEETYRVTFSNGESVVCNGEHLWKTTALQHSVSGRKRYGLRKNHAGIETLALSRFQAVRKTSELAATLLRGDGARNHTIDLQKPLDLPRSCLPMDPYVMGCWLGDGDSDCARITCTPEDLDTYCSEFVPIGYDLTFNKGNSNGAARFRFQARGCISERTNLKQLGLFKNKHILPCYLRASVSQRTDLLQGMMDTDGCINKNGKNLVYCTKLPALAAGFGELLSSLGIKYRMRIDQPVISGRERTYHVFQFHAFREEIRIFRLPRKWERQRSRDALTMRSRSSTVQITNIERIPPVACRCITVDNPTGMFLFGRTMLPTHNSPTLAWWALYLLIADGEQGQKVYLAAKDGQQSREIAGKHVVEMLLQSPELMAECVLNRSLMQTTHGPSRSILKPISSADSRVAKAKEGLNGSILVDETHVVDREFMSRVSRAGISRSEPLLIEVSTAGDDPLSYGKERFDYGRAVEKGDIDDDGLFYLAYAAPQDLNDDQLHADPVKYGKMANPAWGHTVNEEEYRQDYERSRSSLTMLADFKKYRLNIWQQTSNPLIPMGEWYGCENKYTLDDLEGRVCYGGLDLSKTRDTTALYLIFPEDDGEIVKSWCFYWLPQATAERLAKDVGYVEWAKAGHLTLTDGDVVDYDFVRKQINLIRERFDLRRLGFDGTYAAQMMQRLAEEDGMPVDQQEKFPQTTMNFAGPTAMLLRMVTAGTIRHPGNPLLTWQIGNTNAKTDANQNMRPVKPPFGDIRTIDGPVAGIMALEMWNRYGRETAPTISMI